MREPPDREAPRLVLPVAAENDPAVRLIAWAQRLLLKHPAAAQAAFRSLAAEGRRYGDTPEGRAWRARLEASDELRRFRPLWEAATWNFLDDAEADALPGQFIDLIAQALSRTDLEALTAGLAEAPAAARRGAP